MSGRGPEARACVRPHVLLSVAVSVDGYIDDASPNRLLLSNAADFDRVDALRADSDAVLIGAETLRRDNPRLLVNSQDRRVRRVADGKPEYPLRVVVTASGNLDASQRFWHQGGERLVYTTDSGAARLADRFDGPAKVVSLGAVPDFADLLDDLGKRGIERLMVEGGGSIHTAFLAAGLADEIRMAIAPLVVGDPAAPRFLRNAEFPGGSAHRMQLADVSRIGDIALLRYLPKEDSDV
ncbi:RibD family protein [Nocardia jejuensis]|uniref:RibD family protein n=1 Tax=Nocardia jejuensis TaxID=328049 RepID=UPI00082BA85E|nr:dihydrofolate reductase family protein [Nocardia jejuensis]